MDGFASAVGDLAKIQTTLLAQIDNRSEVSAEWTRSFDAQLASAALVKQDNRTDIEKLLHKADAKVNALQAMVWRLGATGDTSIGASIATTQAALKANFNELRGEAEDRELLSAISSMDKIVKRFLAANDEVVKSEELKADIIASRIVNYRRGRRDEGIDGRQRARECESFQGRGRCRDGAGQPDQLDHGDRRVSWR